MKKSSQPEGIYSKKIRKYTVADVQGVFTPEGRLATAEDLAREVLARYTTVSGRLRRQTDKNPLPDNAKQQVDTAKRLLFRLAMVRENLDVGNVEGAALTGFDCGQLFEELRVRPLEDLTRGGRNRRTAQRKGAKSTKEKGERSKELSIRLAEKFQLENPKVQKKVIIFDVHSFREAEGEQISIETIRAHLKGWPRKKKG